MKCDPNHPLMCTYLEKIQHLISMGIKKTSCVHVGDYLEQGYSTDEYCTNASLHRGFYHPSPIYDIVVGNTRRGRLHKTKVDASKITHRFLYDMDGLLKYIETYFQGQVACVEYLFYYNDKRLGVTIDKFNRISTVCEETFEEERLTDFFILNCVYINDVYECFSARSEHYVNDEIGLSACDFVLLSPKSESIHIKKYVFERKNGFLASYSDVLKKKTNSAYVYTITKKRKA